MKPSERLWKVFEETSDKILETKTMSAYTDLIERQNALMFVEIGKILDEIVEPVELPEEELCHCSGKPWKEFCVVHTDECRLNVRAKNEPKETSLRDAEMYRICYEEVIGDMKLFPKIIFTTLTVPEIHKYLQNRLNTGKVNILQYEKINLLTDK